MLKRVSQKPILVPCGGWDAIFNPGIVAEGNIIHMLARCSKIVDGKMVSDIVHFSSSDGITFVISRQTPVLSPDCCLYECDYGFGFEDARVTGQYDVLVTAFGGRFKEDWRIVHFKGNDLFSLRLVDFPITYGFKNGVLYNGGLYFRGPNGVLYYGTGTRYENWHKVMSPGILSWCSKRVGIGAPPISIEGYDIFMFHGVDDNDVYRLGFGIMGSPIDIAIYTLPILEPELEWERKGITNNVVYSCGACVYGDDLFVYYGAADRATGAAYTHSKSILDLWVKRRKGDFVHVS